jgi:hypothetical protein
MSRTFALLMLSLIASSRLWADYDPLLTADVKTEQVDFEVKDAKQWLDSDAVRSVLEKDDQWQTK